MKYFKYIIAILILSISVVVNATEYDAKKVRNFIKDANELYAKANYKEAIKLYRKALELNPGSQVAEFNLASALISLQESRDSNSNSQQEAIRIFTNLSNTSGKIAQKSLFNLGHIAYNNKDYQKSIELYKKVLRKDFRNDKARKYLRMAQMQLNQNQQDKPKEDNEKEQNEDKQDNKNTKDQNEEKQKKEHSQQSKPQDINEENANKILKSIENKEQETLVRVKRRQQDAQRTNKDANGRISDKPW